MAAEKPHARLILVDIPEELLALSRSNSRPTIFDMAVPGDHKTAMALWNIRFNTCGKMK